MDEPYLMPSTFNYSSSTNKQPSYPLDEEGFGVRAASSVRREKPWLPLALRWWFAALLFSLMVGMAIALEVAFAVINTRQGFPVKDVKSATSGVLHYVFTLPPVAIVMVIIALWTRTDIDIKKMQPYVDLAHGNAPAKKSLLLDYTTISTFYVWAVAFRHRHYLVFLSGLMVLFGLGVQPIAAALFTIRDSYSPVGIRPVTGFRTMGLNPDFANMQAAASAAGFVDASSLYNLSQPNFIQDGWTVSQLDTPTDFMLNGTMFANTTAILSTSRCETPDSTIFSPTQAGSILSGTWKGCQVSFVIDNSPPTQYGSEILANCSANTNVSPEVQFKPVVFWAYSQADNKATLAFCQPHITAYNVGITVDLASGTLNNVTIQSNYIALNNVTGEPLNGQAFNGLGFNLSVPDRFVGTRSNATAALLPAAIFQTAARSPGGIESLFQDNVFVQCADQVYSLFLALLAKELYFIQSENAIDASIWAIEKRLWMSPLSTHLLSGILLFFTVSGVLVHYFHYQARRPVYLLQEPGTIASAASIASHALFHQLLAGRRGPAEIEAVLRDKRFRLDPATGAIIVDDTPDVRRRSETEKPLLYRLSKHMSRD